MTEAAAVAGCLVFLLDDGGVPGRRGVTVAGHRNDVKTGRTLTRKFLDGELPPGSEITGGIREGFLVFPENGAAYRKAVPGSVRREVHSLVSRMKKGLIQVVKPVYG